MPDMIAAGETWFQSQRREHLATDVSYQPAIGTTRTVRATVVVGRWESIDAAGQMLRTETQDFFVDTTDLAQDPKKGDRIVAGGFTYEVMIPPGAEHHWRWSDRSKTLRRIHTMVTEGPSTRTPAVPGPPTAVAGANGSPVTWTAPVVTGEYVVTSYKVYAGDVLQEIVTAPSRTSVGTFTVGTVVRVSAVNAIGEGAKSSPVTIPPTVPGAPTITQAFFNGNDGSTNVFWDAPTSNGGAAITGYMVYFDDDLTTDYITINSTWYAFINDYTGANVELSAVNAVGEGPKSAPVTVVVA
jgi:hypothetical protein